MSPIAPCVVAPDARVPRPGDPRRVPPPSPSSVRELAAALPPLQLAQADHDGVPAGHWYPALDPRGSSPVRAIVVVRVDPHQPASPAPGSDSTAGAGYSALVLDVSVLGGAYGQAPLCLPLTLRMSGAGLEPFQTLLRRLELASRFYWRPRHAFACALTARREAAAWVPAFGQPVRIRDELLVAELGGFRRAFDGWTRPHWPTIGFLRSGGQR